MSLIKMSFKIEMTCVKCGKKREVDLSYDGDDLKAAAEVMGKLDKGIGGLKMIATPDLKPTCGPKC